MSNRQTLQKVPAAQRVAELIEGCIENPPSLRALALEVGLTPFQLSRLFRRYHGETIPGYLRRLRMARAAALLTKSDMVIGQIALVVGYNSIGAFVRGFTRELGRTPSVYRREKRSVATATATATVPAEGPRGLYGLAAAWLHELFLPLTDALRFCC